MRPSESVAARPGPHQGPRPAAEPGGASESAAGPRLVVVRPSPPGRTTGRGRPSGAALRQQPVWYSEYGPPASESRPSVRVGAGARPRAAGAVTVADAHCPLARDAAGARPPPPPPHRAVHCGSLSASRVTLAVTGPSLLVPVARVYGPGLRVRPVENRFGNKVTCVPSSPHLKFVT